MIAFVNYLSITGGIHKTSYDNFISFLRQGYTTNKMANLKSPRCHKKEFEIIVRSFVNSTFKA